MVELDIKLHLYNQSPVRFHLQKIRKLCIIFLKFNETLSLQHLSEIAFLKKICFLAHLSRRLITGELIG